MSTVRVVKTLEKQLSSAQQVINDLVRENYELKTQLTSVIKYTQYASNSQNYDQSPQS